MKHTFLDPDVAGDQFVNKAGIARRYAVSTRTVDNWISRRIIPFTKIGGVVRFNIIDVDGALSKFKIKNDE